MYKFFAANYIYNLTFTLDNLVTYFYISLIPIKKTFLKNMEVRGHTHILTV